MLKTRFGLSWLGLSLLPDLRSRRSNPRLLSYQVAASVSGFRGARTSSSGGPRGWPSPELLSSKLPVTPILRAACGAIPWYSRSAESRDRARPFPERIAAAQASGQVIAAPSMVRAAPHAASGREGFCRRAFEFDQNDDVHSVVRPVHFGAPRARRPSCR